MQWTREQMYELTARWNVPPPLDRIMVGGSWAESGWNTTSEGDFAGGVPHSIGLFQLYDSGLGANMTVAERQDPDRQMQVMVPEYRRAYAYWSNPQAHGEGELDRETIAARTCAWAERPFQYRDPNSAAQQRYREGYRMAARNVEDREEQVRVYPFGAAATYGPSHWDGLKALDVFAPYGTPITACGDGVAKYRAYPLGGHTVTLYCDEVDHEGGQVYYHAHMILGSGHPDGTDVRVQAGEVIGLTGDTGNAAGKPPHCHWAAATQAYGIDADGAGDIDPAPLLDDWKEGAGNVADCSELVNAIGYLSGDVADSLQGVHDEVQVALERLAGTDLADEDRELVNDTRERLDAMQASLNTLRSYQQEQRDAQQAPHAESVREEVRSYRGESQRELRSELEGEGARAQRPQDLNDQALAAYERGEPLPPGVNMDEIVRLQADRAHAEARTGWSQPDSRKDPQRQRTWSDDESQEVVRPEQADMRPTPVADALRERNQPASADRPQTETAQGQDAERINTEQFTPHQTPAPDPEDGPHGERQAEGQATTPQQRLEKEREETAARQENRDPAPGDPQGDSSSDGPDAPPQHQPHQVPAVEGNKDPSGPAETDPKRQGTAKNRAKRGESQLDTNRTNTRPQV